jgi:hypothetical protein
MGTEHCKGCRWDRKLLRRQRALERLKAVVCREDRGLKRVQKATEGRRGDRGL